MKNPCLTILVGTVLALGLVGCQNRHYHTQILYDSPTRFVRLEVDPTVGGGHSHPADITVAEMTAILSGLMIDEPTYFMPSLPFFSTDEEPPRHPAFNTGEIGFLAPLLVKGLGMATPDEVITFYQSVQQTAIIRKVTSGGIVVNGDELRIIVSNYRSPTHYASDPGTADMHDDRLTPLRSIAPQRAKLDFEPAAAVVPSQKGVWSNLFRPDRPEITILLSRLRAGLSGRDGPSN